MESSLLLRIRLKLESSESCGLLPPIGSKYHRKNRFEDTTLNITDFFFFEDMALNITENVFSFEDTALNITEKNLLALKSQH